MIFDLALVEPTETLRSAFLDLAEDFQRHGEYYTYQELAQRDFPAYLREMQRLKIGQNLSPGYVSMDSYWLVRNGTEVIGESRLRHSLTAVLRVEGGHIGYAIRPSARRQGYGTRILALTLEKAAGCGLERVLVTCDTENTPSARIIEKNGGVLEDYVTSPFSGKQVSRYWIDLPAPGTS